MKKVVFIGFWVALMGLGYGVDAETQPLPARIRVQKIPDIWTHSIGLLAPKPQAIVKDAILKVKGYNRTLKGVWLNGKPLTVRPDGRFFFELALPTQNNVQRAMVTFETKDGTLVDLECCWKRLLRHESAFTRADLAVWLASNPAVTVSPFVDVPLNHWAAGSIAQAAQKGWMFPFPDGRFRPEDPVSRLELGMTLVRFHHVPLDTTSDPLLFSDLNLHSWETKYVKAALKKGWWKRGRSAQPQKSVSWAEFSELVASEINQNDPVCLGERLPTPVLTILPPKESHHEQELMKPFTRLEAVTWVATLFDVSGNAHFNLPKDLKMMSLTPAQKAALAQGLIRGDEDGLFHPKRLISRIEILILVLRASGKEQPTTASVQSVHLPFHKVATTYWGAYSLKQALQLGWIEADPTYDPEAPMLRHEFQVLINRVKNSKSKGT